MRKQRLIYILLLFALLLVASISVCIGRFSGLKLVDVPRILLSQVFPFIEKTWTETDERVVLFLRIPRIVAAAIVGASLAISGVTFQALFSNPVASPDTLGVTAGAAFGAVLGMILNVSAVGVRIISFTIGCVVVLSVFLLSSYLSKGRGLTIFLILIGMVTSAIFQALLSILKYAADPIDQLPKITYWLMGSFCNIESTDVPSLVLLFIIGSLPIFLMRWRLNLLSLSEYEAKSIGENINYLRMCSVVCATLLTSSAVALTGGIGWVGLVIPHITRMLVGNDARRLLPTAALIGAIFLLTMDDIARCATVYELPISVLTSLVGAPVFFAVILRKRGSISNDN